MIIFYVGIVILVIIYYILWINEKEGKLGSNTTGYLIGSSQYIPETIVVLRKVLLKNTKGEIKRNWDDDIILVTPTRREKDNWGKDDVLVFKRYCGQLIKEKFVILREIKTGYLRIARCIAESSNFPPLFDGSETLIEYEILGVLESSYKQ